MCLTCRRNTLANILRVEINSAAFATQADTCTLWCVITTSNCILKKREKNNTKTCLLIKIDRVRQSGRQRGEKQEKRWLRSEMCCSLLAIISQRSNRFFAALHICVMDWAGLVNICVNRQCSSFSSDS